MCGIYWGLHWCWENCSNDWFFPQTLQQTDSYGFRAHGVDLASNLDQLKCWPRVRQWWQENHTLSLEPLVVTVRNIIYLLERSPREENNNPLHHSCLENSMERRAWLATVYRVARVGDDLVTKPPATSPNTPDWSPCRAGVWLPPWSINEIPLWGWLANTNYL